MMKKFLFCTALVIFLFWLAMQIIMPEKIFRSAVSQDNNHVAYLVEKGGFPLPYFSIVSADLIIKDRANREVLRTTLLSDRDAFYETEAEFREIRWVSNTEGEYYAGPSKFQIPR
ncbi:MAG TPA: hypothetical protein VGH50_07110 [Candidatus Binatia bacterium]|jgi:hypothetical protein